MLLLQRSRQAVYEESVSEWATEEQLSGLGAAVSFVEMLLAQYLTCSKHSGSKAQFSRGRWVISEEMVTPIFPLIGSNAVHKLQNCIEITQVTFQLPVVIWLLEDLSFGLWLRQ